MSGVSSCFFHSDENTNSLKLVLCSRLELDGMDFWLLFQILLHVFQLLDTPRSKCSEYSLNQIWLLLIGLLVAVMRVEKSGILNSTRASITST